NGGLGVRLVQLVQIGLHDVDGAGGLTAAVRVHQDDVIRVVGQGVGQVDPADAVVRNPDAIGQLAAAQPLRHLDAEGVVAQKDVADAGDEDGAQSRSGSGGVGRSQALHLTFGKEEAVTGPPGTDRDARVVVH